MRTERMWNIWKITKLVFIIRHFRKRLGRHSDEMCQVPKDSMLIVMHTVHCTRCDFVLCNMFNFLFYSHLHLVYLIQWLFIGSVPFVVFPNAFLSHSQRSNDFFLRFHRNSLIECVVNCERNKALQEYSCNRRYLQKPEFTLLNEDECDFCDARAK